MLSVTADTNIWVSAFNYRGNPRRLIDLAQNELIHLAISDTIIEETRRILAKRFNWSPERIDEAEYQMRDISKHVTPTQTVDVVKDDPDDNRIVECAIEAGSDYLVTGDKDLLRVGSHGTIRIMKVAEFLGIAQGPAR
jgi:putative PIN family toxin of toxin-antitoxin system